MSVKSTQYYEVRKGNLPDENFFLLSRVAYLVAITGILAVALALFLPSLTRSDYYENPECDGYPVIYVDWNMAVTYCEDWRGAYLPTEAQWEKTVRGTDGCSFPWGEGIDATFADYNYDVGDTTAVGAYENGQSTYAVYDMSGNVWEWVADWYGENYYETLDDLANNPTGPSSGEYHVLCGGSWLNAEEVVRTFTRGWIDLSYFDFADFGFRPARNVTS